VSFGNRNLPDPNKVIKKLQKQLGEDLLAVEPFVSKLVILKTRKRTEGITLLGVDSASAKSGLKNFIQQGSYNLENNSNGLKIILGEKLAEKMFVKIGDRITIFALRNDQIPTEDNPPSIEQFIVSGIYESGMSEYDDLNAFVSISVAQEIFGMSNSVSGYNIKVKEMSRINLLSTQLQNFLGYPYYVSHGWNFKKSQSPLFLD